MSERLKYCEECPGVVCLDIANDMRLAGAKNKKLGYIIGEPIANCPVKNGQGGLRRVLTDDVIWELATPLKGWEMHKAYIKRLQDEDLRTLNDTLDGDYEMGDWFVVKAKIAK